MSAPGNAPLSDLEQRLVRLEELTVFQDQALTQLNDALARQQAQLDNQEKRIEALEARLRILWQQFAETGGELTVPPHYATLG